MADWVHCNACFKQPFEIKTQFHLTNCGHIFCENCMKQVPGHCQMCKQKCTCILLSNKMKPDVEKFFTSPKDLLKQIMQVLDFQDGHRQRLAKHRMSTGSSNKNLGSNDKQALGLSEMQREYQRIREENNYLKHTISGMRAHQRDTTPQSRSGTPYQPLMPSPLKKTPGSQVVIDQRFSSATPSNSQHLGTAGHTPGTVLSQNKSRTPSDRISIRTPPVGGVITTPSPCKIYKINNNAAYSRVQQRTPNDSAMHRQRIGNSPVSTQIRSRSATPTNSISRSSSPGTYGSPRDQISMSRVNQKYQMGETTPVNTQSNKTPYTSRPEQNSPMHINSTLDPSQRQIRLTYQPRTALTSKLSSRLPQQPL